MNIQSIVTRLSHHSPTTEARIAVCSHAVEQPNLTRDHLGDEDYEAEIIARRMWIAEHCVGDHVGETVRSGGLVTGKRFHFADADDAFYFRLRF
jgi:hypothetical protein